MSSAAPPEGFTAARNARAKEVQVGGDRDLAAAIRGLTKPTAAAGLANQLVRRDRAALDPLLRSAPRCGTPRPDSTARRCAPCRGSTRWSRPWSAGLRSWAPVVGKPVSPAVAHDLGGTSAGGHRRRRRSGPADGRSVGEQPAAQRVWPGATRATWSLVATAAAESPDGAAAESPDGAAPDGASATRASRPAKPSRDEQSSAAQLGGGRARPGGCPGRCRRDLGRPDPGRGRGRGRRSDARAGQGHRRAVA